MSAQSGDIFLNDSILRDVRDLIGGLKFGTVTIKVHNSKIVQVEVSEKRRFDDVWSVEGGGGI